MYGNKYSLINLFLWEIKDIIKCLLSTILPEAHREFSEYLKGEIVDEIFAVLPDINQILSTLSQIRKQTFSPTTFIQVYSSTYSVSENVAKIILRQLFEHGVIGNQPSMKGQPIFKHEYPNALFNFNENMIIHWGFIRLCKYSKFKYQKGITLNIKSRNVRCLCGFPALCLLFELFFLFVVSPILHCFFFENSIILIRFHS